MDIKSLSEFGHTFQVKIISALLSDQTFVQQVSDILEVDYFQSDANAELVSIIKRYFEKYKIIPTLEAIKSDVITISDAVLRTNVVENLKEAYRHIGSTDLLFIKEKTLDFCKNQTIRKAILDSVTLLEQGNYDEIKVKIDNAMKSGAQPTLGLDYINDIDRRYTIAKRNCVPTRWETINELMGGGLAQNELGIVIGGPGAGKSWMLQSLAAYALQSGKRVVYYTLELDEDYVGRRFDAIFTGISVQNLEYHKEDIEERVKRLKGNLHINFFPEYSITVNGLRAHLDRYVLRNMKPDLVVLDYADCLKPTVMSNGRDSSHQMIGDIYSMLKGMAGELQIPIWSASQANRGAANSDVIQGQDVADSYIKIMKADFILSLQRKMEDKIAGTGRIHIIKNRFGPDGLTYPSKINFTNGHVEIFEKNTVEGNETQRKIDNGNEYARKLIAQKYKDITKGE